MIDSIIDTDLYKLTMGQAVMQHFPRAIAKYRFVNRNPDQPISGEMIEEIKQCIEDMSDLRLTFAEAEFLRDCCPYLTPWYVDWLYQFTFDPSQIKIFEVKREDGQFDMQLEVEGPWYKTIYWEVPLLAIITGVIMSKQKDIEDIDIDAQIVLAGKKAETLEAGDCRFAEFGTRRRFSSLVQAEVVATMSSFGNFIGTSNIRFAMDNIVKPIGTMAHEWVQGVSGIHGMWDANKLALELWADTYGGDLGIALPDTFGSGAFFKDFDKSLAKLYDGVRHDSGPPVDFGWRVVGHYEKLGIDPKPKMIVFSDSLNVDKCVRLAQYFKDKIKVSFGIGTHLTNDVPGTKPANVVLKLVGMDNHHVVKLSDDPGKEIGDSKAIEVAKWMFNIG